LEMGSRLEQTVVAAHRGKLAETADALIEEEINNLEAAVQLRIFVQLDEGKAIDPQEAVQAWLQRYAYMKLKQRLKKAASRGLRAGYQLEAAMEEVNNG
jgi:hypothetical protein